MTKPSIVFTATLLGLCCAHTLTAQIRFGIKAGFNYAQMPLSIDYFDFLEEDEEQMTTGWSPAYHAGGVVEFGFGNYLGLSTGLQFTVKSGKREFSGEVLKEPYTRTQHIMPMYLQLPLSLTFRGGGWYVAAGPYAAYAIAGKSKIRIESGGTSSKMSDDLAFGNEYGKDLSRLDYGAAFDLGYEFAGNFRLSASYQLGIANILPADVVEGANDVRGDWSAKNNVAGLSLTYLFGNGE